MRKLMKFLGFLFLIIFVVVLGAFTTTAIRFSNLPGDLLRQMTAGIYCVGFAMSFLFLAMRKRTLAIFFAVTAIVIIWWWFIPARTDRDWVPEHGIQPHAKFEGDLVTVYNVRNFNYRTEEDFDVDYYDKTFDLSKIQTADFVKSLWDGNTDIAHTLLSFGFSDGSYITISVETRKEKGEAQTGLRGFFKQYELLYILGDERDLLGLRTNFRKEEVYLYPTVIPPNEARATLVDILEKANKLTLEPEFYNTLSHNCTTSLVPHLEKGRGRKRRCDIRLLLNGESDQLAYENGSIDTDLSFEEARRFHHINQYVENGAVSTDYSRRIRPHLPKKGK